ncbi:MAG: hypothetical protein MR270_05360 [Erysipelotrichaceae bacterium]|nr:hypothetical protein [Erysipelotrichaceae bacterium]
MKPIEIIVIISCVLIVGGVFFNYVYRKIKHKPTGECAYCKSHSNGIKLVEDYHNKYHKSIKK